MRVASNLLFSGILLGLLVSAEQKGFAAQSLDVKTMLDLGWAQVQCTALDMGQARDVFDGSTSTLIRTPGINPLVLTLTFSEAQYFDDFRLWFLGGDNRWKVETASSFTDLSGQKTNTSYRLLVPWRTDAESRWVTATNRFEPPQPAKLLRLTLQRVQGDGYVHLSEWEIQHQLRLEPQPAAGNRPGALRWATEPYAPYVIQSSTDLVHWVDQACLTARNPAVTNPASVVLENPLSAFRLRKLSEPTDLPFVTKKVLVLNYDPILLKHGGRKLHEYMGWNDPRQINATYLQELTEVSSNYVRWTITDFIDIDGWPVKSDGFVYTEDSYLAGFSGGSFHSPDAADYAKIIEKFALDRRVKSGEVDEVIIWAGPYFGFYESQMVGAGAYWCNSPPITRSGVPLYVIMALNPERGLDCALESFGHRSESILRRVYGSWSSGATINHLWDKFTRIQKNAPGLAACGNVHYPPNGTADYDYSNTNYVVSFADDWLLNYPDFKGTTRRFNAAEWDFNHHLYLKWWFGHMPHRPGRYTDGKLNNWWGYLVDFNSYLESR